MTSSNSPARPAQPTGKTRSTPSPAIATVVLGMHRSGTSALARVLSLLGCGLPDNLMPPMEGDNDTGFWESRDIAEFNDELLACAGSRWDDWRALPPAWLESPATSIWYPKAQALLTDAFSDQPLVVLKDPRICRLLPFWLKALENASYQTRLALPLRNPVEVAVSLRKRNGFAIPLGQMLWLRHVLDAERDSRGLPRVIVQYADLLDNWRAVLARIQSELALGLPRWSATAEVEIDTFLRDDLRRNQATADLSAHPELSEWVKRAYLALLELSRGSHNSEESHATLDQIRIEFDQASLALGAVLRAEEVAREQAEAANQQAREQLLTEQQEILLLKNQLQATNQQLNHFRHSADVLEIERQRLEKVTQDQQAEALALKTDLDRAELFISRVTHIQSQASWHVLRWLAAVERRLPGLTKILVNLPSAMFATLRLQLPRWKRQRAQARRIIATGLFDSRWYNSQYPFSFFPGVRPIDHWILHGRRNRQLPQPLFDTGFYLSQVPDLDVTTQDPLEHYQQIGARLGYKPNPWFDSRWYLDQHPEAGGSGLNPLTHYITEGAAAGFDPSPEFNTAWYLGEHPEAAEAGTNPLEHFIRIGLAKGFQPRPAALA